MAEIALFVVAYIGVALAGAYLEARLRGDTFAVAWLLWPILLPVLLVAAVFEAVAKIGEDHYLGR